MVEYYNNTLAVEVGWIIENGIISESNYKQLCARGQINVLRRGCNNTPALVAYDSMPERFKRKINKIQPDVHKAAQVNKIESMIENSAAANEYFLDYRLSDGRGLSGETRREYYANAVVLDAVHKLIMSKRARRSALGKSTVGKWNQIAEGVQEIDRTKYPHSLPANPRRLEGRYRRYREDGLESLIHKNFLNKNGAVIDDNVKQSVMIELLADPRNLDNGQIMRMYNTLAENMGWKKVSRSTVGVWREKYELEVFAGRRGTVAHSNEKAMQVKRVAPQYPLYYWTLDGWDVELMYQKFENGRTTYTNRPTVVVVLDACCKYPIGYAVGTHESPELIQAALRNAVQHTAALFGKMYKTQQVQSDRYAIKALTPYYDGIGERVTPAKAKNAKAKIIEPYFGSINKKYCQLMMNWSGFGITSNKDKQPNTEYLNKHKKSFPEYEGVCAQVSAIIERERADKREEYRRLFGEMPTEYQSELSIENYLLLFGKTTGHRNMLQGNGLKITIEGVKRDYDCFDIKFRKHASVRWEVRYDPQDLSRVLAVNEDETLRFVLEEKYVQPMALVERSDGDYEQLQRVRLYNKELEQHIIDFRTPTSETAEKALRELDTLFKLQITDSLGQHKDRRNDVRLSTKTVPLAEPTVDVEDDIFEIY